MRNMQGRGKGSVCILCCSNSLTCGSWAVGGHNNGNRAEGGGFWSKVEAGRQGRGVPVRVMWWLRLVQFHGLHALLWSWYVTMTRATGNTASDALVFVAGQAMSTIAGLLYRPVSIPRPLSLGVLRARFAHPPLEFVHLKIF